jgi:hypothetical protein
VISTGQNKRDPVYAVAAVQARLGGSPAAWVGRIVGVRGVAGRSYCQSWPSPESISCQGWGPSILIDPGRLTLLPPTLGAPNPLLAPLHRLPLTGHLVQAPQQIRWGALATYHVRLRAAPTRVCGTPPCYAAVLLDAALYGGGHPARLQ